MEQESDLRRKIYRQGSVRSETREFSAGRTAGILGFILAGKKDRTEKSGVFPFLLPEIPERVRIERWKNEKKGGMKK